jgi:hypothetical protein
MKIVLTEEEFHALILKHFRSIRIIDGHEIENIAVPAAYSSVRDIVIEFKKTDVEERCGSAGGVGIYRHPIQAVSSRTLFDALAAAPDDDAVEGSDPL